MLRVVWDLNPRKFLCFNGFQGRRFRPLSQPPQNGGTALDRMCRTTCSPWDSNPHYADFKSAASANWARRANPHMRGMCVHAWNRTKDLLIFNQTLSQLSYKNPPTANRFLFTTGTAQVFLQTGNLGDQLVTLPSKSLASSSGACQCSLLGGYTGNVRKDEIMSLNLILQMLESLSYLIDLPISGGKKNSKTKCISENPSNRRQRRAQDKKNHQTNIRESARTMKSSKLFR